MARRGGRQWTALVAVAALLCGAAAADAPPASPTTTTASGGVENRPVGGRSSPRPPAGAGGLWGWVRAIAALIVVAALVLVLRRALRRIALRRGAAPSGSLRLVAQVNVSAKERLLLVRLGRRLLLIGSAPGGLAALSEITDPAEVAELTGAPEKALQTRAPAREPEA
jgi:flagellar biogenesis protein FliO